MDNAFCTTAPTTMSQLSPCRSFYLKISFNEIIVKQVYVIWLYAALKQTLVIKLINLILFSQAVSSPKIC